MIATTIEQSERLLATGVSPDTADMMWVPVPTRHKGVVEQLYVGRVTPNGEPAWSLSALWNLAKEKGIALDFSTAEDTADGIIETLVSKLTQTNR